MIAVLSPAVVMVQFTHADKPKLLETALKRCEDTTDVTLSMTFIWLIWCLHDSVLSAV